jgi:hypothetical protein
LIQRDLDLKAEAERDLSRMEAFVTRYAGYAGRIDERYIIKLRSTGKKAT